MPKSNSIKIAVFAADWVNGFIKPVTLTIKNKECFVQDDAWYTRLTFDYDEVQTARERTWGEGWTCSSIDSHVCVSSSEAESIHFLKTTVASHKFNVERISNLLAQYNEDDNSVVETIQKSTSITVTHNEDDGTRYIKSIPYHGLLCHSMDRIQQIPHALEKCFGVSLNHFPNGRLNVCVNINTIDVFLDANTLDEIAKQYKEKEPVCDKLGTVWRGENPYFDINFVHYIPESLDFRFAKPGEKQRLNSDFTYDELHRAICMQLPRVISTSGRTSKHKKSKCVPIQFVASASTQPSLLSPNTIVMEYNAAKQPEHEKYYGLTQPLVVGCCYKPDNTIFLQVQSSPEHTLVLSRSQYKEYTTRGASLLDALMEHNDTTPRYGVG